MKTPEAHERLRKRALEFHRTLAIAGAYSRPVSEDEYLALVEEEIQRTVTSMESEDPWLTLISFPERLLFGLERVLYISGWDATGQAKHLFPLFEELLPKIGLPFSWAFDESAQTLRFEVGDCRWQVRCQTLRFIDEPLSFSRIEPNLFPYLESRGWTLFPVASGDTFERFMLIRNEGVSRIKEFIIPGYRPLHEKFDQRVMWLFEGVPDDKKPNDPWKLLEGPLPE